MYRPQYALALFAFFVAFFAIGADGYAENMSVNATAASVIYGQRAEIYATVKGNTTPLELVTATWNNTFVNETTGLVEVMEDGCGGMTLIGNTSETEHTYRCYSSLLYNSGTYNVTVDVFDDTDGDYIFDAFATNTTLFNVSFGQAVVGYVIYNSQPAKALVLRNQTFNVTAYISVAGGDMWDINVTLNSSDLSAINTSALENQTIHLGNRTSGNYTLVTWQDVYANSTGLVALTISAEASGGNSSFFVKYPQVIDVIADVTESTINITDTQDLQVKFAGNLSPAGSINVTFENEFGQQNSTVFEEYYSTDGRDCYSIEGDSKNVALLSYGTVASDAGGFVTYDPNATVDGNPSSYWYGITTTTGPAELNITFNSTRNLKDVRLLWNDNNGDANVTVYYYYYDWSSMHFPLTGDRDMPLRRVEIAKGLNAPNATNTTTIDFIKGNVKIVSIVQSAENSQLNIYSVEAYTAPFEDSVPDCIIYNVSYAPQRSGTYVVSPRVLLEKSSLERQEAASFFVNYGRPEILFGESILVLGAQEYLPQIKAVGGDIRNMTVNISFSNTTLLDLAPAENASKNISFVAYNTADEVAWNLNASEEGFVNVTITANSTSLTGMFVNDTGEFQVIASDLIPPSVNGFWFLYNNTNMTNLKTDFVIYANITDNGTYVKNASANVLGPDGAFTKAAVKYSQDIWAITLNSNLTKKGQYAVNISAYDLTGNLNYSGEAGGPSSLYFDVTDSYHVGQPAHNVYNRGETVSVSLLDINNNTVEGANWTVNITKHNGSETSALVGSMADYYAYSAALNDTEGNYSIRVINATKDGNHINSTIIGFNVSSYLGIEFNTTFKQEYAPSESLGTIMATLYNARGEQIYISSIMLYYLGDEEAMPYDPASYVYHPPLAYSATSSPASGAIIPLVVNTTYNNNTGQAIKYIKTGSQSGSPGGGSSGPSVGGYFSSPGNATPEINFNYTIENIERDIVKGVPETIMAVIANTGNVGITVYSKAGISPLNISLDSQFILNEKQEKSFQISAYANLTVEPGTYYVDVVLYNSQFGLEKTRTLKLTVVESPGIVALLELKSALEALDIEIASFESSGIDVSSLREKTARVSQILESGDRAIEADSAEALESVIGEAKASILEANAQALPLKTTKFLIENKWNLIGAGIASLSAAYIALGLVMPYIRIGRSIRRLRRREKIVIDTRKATEKQYFMRQINEATFNKIMADEQDKHLKIKSELARLNEEQALLKRFRIGAFRHLEDDKRKQKERIRKEKGLKEMSKRTMSDVIISHDMKKRNPVYGLFFGRRKKKSGFVMKQEGVPAAGNKTIAQSPAQAATPAKEPFLQEPAAAPIQPKTLYSAKPKESTRDELMEIKRKVSMIRQELEQ